MTQVNPLFFHLFANLLFRRIVLQKYAKEIDEMYIQAEKEFNA